MRKIRLTLLLALTFSVSFAQLDTLDDYLLRSSGFFVIGIQGAGGNVAGTNQYTSETGNNYDVGAGYVRELLIWAFPDTVIGQPDSFEAKIYNVGADSLPAGQPLARKKFSIIDTFTNPFYGFTGYRVVFDNPPFVQNRFVAAITTSSVDDTIAVVVNDPSGDGFGEGRSCQKLSPNFGGIWLKMKDIWVDWDADVMIMPIVELQFNVSVSASATSVCPGDQVTLTANVTGGSGQYDISWTPMTGLSNPFSAQTNATVNQTTTYTVRAIDLGNNDTLFASVTITVNAIMVDAGRDTTIGCGQTADLLATISGVTTGATLEWTDASGNVLANSLNLDDVTEGTYTFTATNAFGCSDSDDVTVTLSSTNQVVDFSIPSSNPPNVCLDEPLTFVNTSTRTTGWSWLWEIPQLSTTATTTDLTFTFTNLGNYTIILTGDSASCSLSTSKQVTAVPCTGIEDLQTLDGVVDVYPNPNAGVFTLTVAEFGNEQDVTMKIYTLDGKLVYSTTINLHKDKTTAVNLESLHSGVYILEIAGKEKVVKDRITIQK